MTWATQAIKNMTRLTFFFFVDFFYLFSLLWKNPAGVRGAAEDELCAAAGRLPGADREVRRSAVLRRCATRRGGGPHSHAGATARAPSGYPVSRGFTKRCRLYWLASSVFVYAGGKGGGVVLWGLSQSVQPVHRSPNKLWSSNSIINL
jgi:hypothetical protein